MILKLSRREEAKRENQMDIKMLLMIVIPVQGIIYSLFTAVKYVQDGPELSGLTSIFGKV